MTRQTWVAFVAAVVFVAAAGVMALVPVPFVTWSPGGAYDTLGKTDGKPAIQVDGVDTYPTSGQLDLTTLGVTRADSRLSLPEATLAYWMPHRDTLPRDAVYPVGKSVEEVEAEEAEMMSNSQDEAIVAALRAADQPVAELPQVTSVLVSGPSKGRLEPADLIVSIDGTLVTDVEEVKSLIAGAGIGHTLTFEVIRDREQQTVTVTTGESTEKQGEAVVGITVEIGYRYAAEVSFGIDPEIGGPSAGQMFALGIYDKITPGELTGGRHIAGTGTISADGEVGAIGGIQQKIATAEEAGATIFLVPSANCRDVAGLETDLTLVSVDTLQSSIAALQAPPADLADEQKVPHCR